MYKNGVTLSPNMLKEGEDGIWIVPKQFTLFLTKEVDIKNETHKIILERSETLRLSKSYRKLYSSKNLQE